MTKRNQRAWSAEEKLRILEEARQADVTISEVCRRYQIAPGQFYAWEKQAKKGALEALKPKPRKPKSDPSAPLQAELEQMRRALAELTIENLQLKKGLWP
tara:strand:- start:59 stop:358 length:300 start_codon:yes stop_codon:yes gene_type:complete